MTNDLRARCVAVMTASVWPEGTWSAEAECMLDAVLPVLADAIKPHRWDIDYPDSAPDECRVVPVDTFWNGVLHAARVVRELLPPVIREPLTGGSTPIPNEATRSNATYRTSDNA